MNIIWYLNFARETGWSRQLSCLQTRKRPRDDRYHLEQHFLSERGAVMNHSTKAKTPSPGSNMGRPRVQVDALVMGGLRSGGGGVDVV